MSSSGQEAFDEDAGRFSVPEGERMAAFVEWLAGTPGAIVCRSGWALDKEDA